MNNTSRGYNTIIMVSYDVLRKHVETIVMLSIAIASETYLLTNLNQNI